MSIPLQNAPFSSGDTFEHTDANEISAALVTVNSAAAAAQTSATTAATAASTAQSAVTTHTDNTSNPHAVTKTQVGLGSVENYSIASQAEAEAGSASTKYMTPQRVAQAIAALETGGGGGGDSTTTAVQASRPAASNDGNIFLPTNGFHLQRDTGTVWAAWGPLFPMTLPVDGDFAWANQGTATVDSTQGGVTMVLPAIAGDNLRVRYKSSPSTPYSVTAAFLVDMRVISFNAFGLVFRQSSDGKLATNSIAAFAGAYGFSFAAYKYTSPTAFSAAYVSAAATGIVFPRAVMWLRITDNGTNRICEISANGQHWRTIHSIGRTDFLTANQVGWYATSESTTDAPIVTLLSWKET